MLRVSALLAILPRFHGRGVLPVLRIILLVSGVSGGLLACTDLSKLAGTQPLPAGTVDPSVYNTPAGAVQIYQEAVDQFQGSPPNDYALTEFVLTSGLLTDELQAGNFGGRGSAIRSSDENLIDARQLPTGGSVGFQVYNFLNQVRGYASLGIGALGTYDDTAPSVLRGQLYTYAGYVEVFLADLFCSGIPLSTLDFNSPNGYTYHAGSSTLGVYADAIAKFDTALTLSVQNDSVLNLARVGKGRAWLDAGNFDSAAAAVARVPIGFTYQVVQDWSQTQLNPTIGISQAQAVSVTVSDQEGGNGLLFGSNGDPRDSVEEVGVNAFGVPQYAPFKYGGAAIGIASLTVADWVEAKLIVAEAALNNPTQWGSWLDTLNYLRANAPIPGTTQPNPTALPPLRDPGTNAARVALLFRERAYWLFLTGHRQGDLRRLIRQYGTKYGFTTATVYPSGTYPLGGPIPQYGNDVNIPVPSTENINPKFTGCISRGA